MYTTHGTDAMLLTADPELFVVAHRSRVTARTARLLACAVCRHVWHLLPDASRGAVLVAERHADGLTDEWESWEAWMAADRDGDRCLSEREELAVESALCASWPEIEDGMEYVREHVLTVAKDLQVEPSLLVSWLTCLLAEPVAIPQTVTIVSLARAIRDQQAWDRLPVLADAFEEAGCTDAGLLAHMRGPGPHCRGCYAIGRAC